MAAEEGPQRDAALFEERLATLRARFAERLRRDAAELAELMGSLSGEGSATAAGEPLRRIRSLAHRLHGTAAAFGQRPAGEAAARVEAAAEAALAEAGEAAAGTARAERLAALRAAMRGLDAAVLEQKAR